MNAIALSCTALACISGGALLGMYLRRTLAEHHLSADAKDVVRLGTGLIGTIAALVLGLLIASAKSSATLLADFWAAVDTVLRERGVIR
jgi:hypothetical protein